jgi:hypothetical protein
MRLISPVIAAVVAALFTLRLQIIERERAKATLRALQTISDMNHHIRNALQVISHESYAGSKSNQNIAEAVSRIEWTLREICQGSVPLVSVSMLRKLTRNGRRNEMNTKAAALTGAILWSGSVLLVSTVNLMRPRYGRKFLELISSIYPGYTARRSSKQVAIATLYAAVDGAVGGTLVAAIYNKVSVGVEKGNLLRAA